MVSVRAATLLSAVLAAPFAVVVGAECADGICDVPRALPSHTLTSAASVESLLLQTRRVVGKGAAAARVNSSRASSGQGFCDVGDAVRCPGSSVWCRGEECCPGGEGESNFPCPSAPGGWGEAQCENTVKVYDCTSSWQCKVGDVVQCPGSGIWCTGQECCPGAEGEPNFPCPSAPVGWGEGQCESAAKAFDCTPGEECRVGDHVQCPGSPGVMCTGKECCPGAEGEPSYPCPSAPSGWGATECESTAKAYDCTGSFQCIVDDPVQCPGSGTWCSGEECCPGAEGEPNFPCPSAPSGWGSGTCQNATKRWDCTSEPLLAD